MASMQEMIKGESLYLLGLKEGGGWAKDLAYGLESLGIQVISLPGREDHSKFHTSWLEGVPRGSLILTDSTLAPQQEDILKSYRVFVIDRKNSNFSQIAYPYAAYFKVNYPLSKTLPSWCVPFLLRESRLLRSVQVTSKRPNDVLVACSVSLKPRYPAEHHKKWLDSLLRHRDLSVHVYWYSKYPFMDVSTYQKVLSTFKLVLSLPGGEEQCFRNAECFRQQVAMIYQRLPIRYPHQDFEHRKDVFFLGETDEDVSSWVTTEAWRIPSDRGLYWYNSWYRPKARAFYLLRVIQQVLNGCSNLMSYVSVNKVPYEGI
jgi:hypothetical protein